MTRTFSFIRLRRDESGQTAVLAALMMPVLVGMVGLAIDVGHAFDHRKQMQHAADSAALAGAYGLKAAPSISAADLATIARSDAAGNRFTHGTSGITVTVCKPGVDWGCTSTYSYTAASGAVKVTISQAKSTFLTSVLGFNSLTIGASAIAADSTTGNAAANFVILGLTDNTFTNSGGSTVDVDGSIYINSNAVDALKTGGTIIADGGVFINGGYDISGGGSITPTATTGAPVIPDPLASLPTPTPTGPIRANPNVSGGTVTLQPGMYTNGLSIAGGDVTLAPGEYYVTGGDFEAQDATVNGTEVFIYVYGTKSTFSIAKNTTTVNLSAPTSGTYRGILLFQERTSEERVEVQGGATVNLTGVLYARDAPILINGGSNSGLAATYTVIVCHDFTIGGGGGFYHNDYSSIGGSPLGGGSGGITLAE